MRPRTSTWLNVGIRFGNFCGGGAILVGLFGALFIAGDAVLRVESRELRIALVCLWAVAFAYIFLRIYPRVWRFMWNNFK